MAMNRLEEARSILQRAVDVKADNLFVHQLLYDLAFMNGDTDVMQRQMKWSEGKPSQYLLLNEATQAAAAHGQMQKAGELMQRSVQVSQRLGFKGTTAATLANWAVMQAEVGNASKARELAASSSALARGRSNLGSVAVALAMTGDVSRAPVIMEDLGHRFPADTLLHQVSIPCVRALIELERKAPEQATEALKAATPYELGTVQGLFPIYIRGQAYLRAKRRGGGGGRISEDRGPSRDCSDGCRAFAGQAGSGAGLFDDRGHSKGEGRVSGFLCAMEGCGP
jgi:hypothetical protein